MRQWKEISKPQQVEAMKAAHAAVSVVSAANIANLLSKEYEGVTRSSVAGFFYRNADAMQPLRLAAPGSKSTHTANVANIVKVAKHRAEPPKLKPGALPTPRAVSIPEPSPLKKELWQLETCECKWPVEGYGIKALFCAVETGTHDPKQPYCPHHAARSRGAGTRSEQRASEPLALKPSLRLQRIGGRI